MHCPPWHHGRLPVVDATVDTHGRCGVTLNFLLYNLAISVLITKKMLFQIIINYDSEREYYNFNRVESHM